MIRTVIAGLALAFTIPATAAQPIAGRWLTADGGAVVAIGPCGATLCGKVARVLKIKSGTPNAAARARQAIGIVILTDLVPDGDAWNGQISDPTTGKKYSARLTRNGSRLNVKGCVSIFCKTLIWTAA